MSSRFGFSKLNNRINPTINSDALTKALQMGQLSTQMVSARVTDIVLDNNIITEVCSYYIQYTIV